MNCFTIYKFIFYLLFNSCIVQYSLYMFIRTRSYLITNYKLFQQHSIFYIRINYYNIYYYNYYYILNKKLICVLFTFSSYNFELRNFTIYSLHDFYLFFFNGISKMNKLENSLVLLHILYIYTSIIYIIYKMNNRTFYTLYI